MHRVSHTSTLQAAIAYLNTLLQVGCLCFVVTSLKCKELYILQLPFISIHKLTHQSTSWSAEINETFHSKALLCGLCDRPLLPPEILEVHCITGHLPERCSSAQVSF